jgi:AraC-like DNA-binding protein
MSRKCHSILLSKNGRSLAEIASVSADLPHGHLVPEHSHPEDQLLFASKGVMTLRTKQGVWVVPPLRAVWIPADTPHSVCMSGEVSMRTLYLLPNLCRTLPAKCFVMNVSAFLKELILHACTFAKLNKKAANERRIVEILVDQLKTVGSVPLQLPHPDDSRAKRVVEALHANPSDQRTLVNLCKDCGASKRTIQRLFLEETKMTFAKWRQQLRLLHGMELLASGEKVSAAALEAGYSSTSAFISMFRKQLGTTPTRYLKSGNERDHGPEKLARTVS